jgi:hypothetical protein
VSISVESDVVSTLDEAQRIARGQANKDAPHLTVPFYMSLAQSISLKDALECCRPDIRKAVKDKAVRLLAIAHGIMADQESSWPVQFVLLHGRFHKDDPELYLVFDSVSDEMECAVLMDGDGLRCPDSQPMTQEESVAYWMGGFLGWNEKCPGLYRLRYALIKS